MPSISRKRHHDVAAGLMDQPNPRHRHFDPGVARGSSLPLHAGMEPLCRERAPDLADGNLLERYRTLDAARPDIVDRLAEMQSRDELVTDGYWQGESDVQTATKLQDRASQSVKAEGGNVISMQTLDPEETEGQELPIRRALLKMRLATTLEGLAATVYDIETAVPYMFIDHLIVTPQRSGRRIAGQTETSDQEQKLDVRLNVFGYVRDQSPPSAEIEEGEG